ncbi:MAG: hypothetical protein WAV20_19255 [Blastocatellia bacterium]
MASDGEKTGKGSRGASASSAADDVRRAFSGLPLDQKLSTLIRIELDMVGDAVDALVSAASDAIDEVAKACSKGSTSPTPGPGGQASAS